MTKYIYIGVAILFVLMAGQIYLLKKENRQLLINEGILKTQVHELAETIKIKDKDIEAANKSIDDLKAESDARSAAAEKARQAARQAGEQNRVLADQLLKARRQQGEDECMAANRILNEYLDKQVQ
jgi:RNase H-fold protein (predicted Holliday junction resolvase)